MKDPHAERDTSTCEPRTLDSEDWAAADALEGCVKGRQQCVAGVGQVPHQNAARENESWGSRRNYIQPSAAPGYEKFCASPKASDLAGSVARVDVQAPSKVRVVVQ